MNKELTAEQAARAAALCADEGPLDIAEELIAAHDALPVALDFLVELEFPWDEGASVAGGANECRTCFGWEETGHKLNCDLAHFLEDCGREVLWAK